jgi:hypothetical protein
MPLPMKGLSIEASLRQGSWQHERTAVSIRKE